ncbi:uncharacterized protein [Eurosta solidaginis]|uniref:uncharacterized protein n=1 Tax=Eurosta solidaginis TaxID=178769 RepID=UPI003530E242
MLTTKLAIWQYFSIFAILLLEFIECKSFFGIGTRIINDQLILKDILQARLVGVDKGPEVGFNYAIPEPITYIEIVSEQDVLAEVNFSYQNDLVQGTVISKNDQNDSHIDELFEVQISIYGFNDTMLNVNPSYILNRDQQFQGILVPDESSEFDYEIDSNELEVTDTKNESEEAANEFDEDMEYADDFGDPDKVIELGKRQINDYLLYETYQTSQTSTEEPSNHTVIFYYIDSNFITYVKFIIFDHTIDKSSMDYQPPVAEYTHFSSNSLKAKIFDGNTTNLFVQMLLYGYKPDDLPGDYRPFLRSSVDLATELQRLEMFMNAKTHKTDDNTEEINFETGERNEMLSQSTSAPKGITMRSNFDSEEINFETGERNELQNNDTGTSASIRNHLNGFTVFTLIITINLLINNK